MKENRVKDNIKEITMRVSKEVVPREAEVPNVVAVEGVNGDI